MIVWVLLGGMAVARATRLVGADSITERPRDWIVGHSPGWFSYALTCPWCVSGWFALAFALWRWSITSPMTGLVGWFATWWAACALYWLSEALASMAARPTPDVQPDIAQLWRDQP